MRSFIMNLNYLDSLKDIDIYVQNDMIITLNRSLSGVMDELDLMCRNYVQAARRRKVTKGKELREQIAVALVMAVRSVRKAHKSGGCCGGCSGCPHECSCKQK